MQGVRVRVQLALSSMEAKLQVSSEDWLKVHGLEENALMLDQLLPVIGFLQSKSEVGCLGRTVSSHYGDGVFIRQENSSGAVYNICGGMSGGKLVSIEEELKEAIGLLKARYEWMTTGSRLPFGVVSGRRVVMVIDCYGAEPAWLSSLVQVATSVVQEQFIHLESFNIISCTSGVSCWNEGLTSVTNGNLEGVLQWLENIKPQTPPLKSNVLQALSRALEHTEADSVYLLSYGDSSLRAFEQLLERVTPSLLPVNVTVLNCTSDEKLEQYKSLASTSNGKCHCYTPPSPLTGSNPLLSSYSSLASSTSSRRSGSGRGQTSRPSSAATISFSQGLTDADTLAIWDELDSARNTLAQIQALRVEIEGAACNCSPPEPPKISDTSMTSEQWLEVYGLRAKKLTFENLVESLAFKHCNGMVQLPLRPKHKRTGKIEMVSHTKVVHAQYCKEFVHLRWPEGEVIHVLLSKHAHRVFCEGVEGVVGACRKRLTWLKNGSRELFGTLLEKKIVIVVDTSVSMGTRLAMLKEKLLELIKEQLSTKDQFTVFHFNSKVYPWRDNLVSSSPQTLAAVAQWVDGLVTGGSTNTQAALVKAMTVSGVEAVYLMTDGRPDTPTDILLAKIQQLPKVPVHTISFNCGDSKANHFLAKLASNTGGRYHYLSTDVSDPEGPKTYQSEDITQLDEEIKSGLDHIERANQLLAECQVTKKRGGKKKQQKTTILHTTKDVDNTSDGEEMGKPLVSSKKWLIKNCLSALKLTLMDALGPTAIPCTAKHVPILRKDVHSRVFSELFPIAHVSDGNRVTLIHPGAADLIGYEKRLDEQMEVYYSRLSRLAWEAIPNDNRSSVLQECGLKEGQTPSYREYQEILSRVLSDLNWPRPQLDFDLLDVELRQAESYKKYSQSLREEVKKTCFRSGDETQSVASYSVPLMDNPLFRVSKKSHSSRPSKCATVIVRSEIDGFYYPGVVSNKQNRKSISIQLVDKLEISSNSLLVIPVGGARPCPVLYRGDHVLVRVRASRNGRHPGPDGRCDYYVPGRVQVLPENERKGHALHSVLVFSGHVITCDRRGIVKISEKRYTDTCEYIHEKMEVESTESGNGSHSQASYADSSICIPTPPVSDQGSETSSLPSTVRTSVHSSRASSIASSHMSALSNGPSLTTLIENQRAQDELIQKYREELLSMQEKQTKMEEQLASQLGRGSGELCAILPSTGEHSIEIPHENETEPSTVLMATSPVHSESHKNKQTKPVSDNSHDDFDDFPDEDVSVQETAPVSPSTVTDNAQHDSAAPVANNDLLPTEVEANKDPPVHHTEVGVNTDATTEERGIVTEPMTESVVVGTEWSHSETETSDDCVDETDNVGMAVELSTEELLAECTPISTPLPTPPLSRAPSPDHTPLPTPPLSHAPSPDHTLPASSEHSNTLLDRIITPSQSNTSTLSQESHPPTPHITPVHSSIMAPPLINQQVLARWPDDGWYYRCLVVGVAAGEGHWEVKDASGDIEVIPSCDIITDLVDSQRPLELRNTVAGLHPSYSCSYAPGRVVGIDGQSFTVEFYDCSQNTLPRHEIYRLINNKHNSDVEYIRQKEAEWVGGACLARRNSDGLYYPCKVERQVSWSRKYIVQWADGSHQEQQVHHLYGPLTRKRPLRIGDHVIALADSKVGVCMPGTVVRTKQGKIIVEFCDGQNDAVDPTHCYWVSQEYHAMAVEYICSHAPPPSNVGGADDTVTTETDDVTETSDY